MTDFIARSLVEFPRALQKPAVRQFALGVLAATHTVLWLSWFAGTWGVSLTTVVAMAVSFGSAALLSDRFNRVPGFDARLMRPGAQFLLAGWTLALPGLLALSVEPLRRLDLEVVARPAVSLSIILVAALLLLTPGWIALLATVKLPHSAADASRMVSPWTLLGAAGMLFLMPVTLAVTFDLQSIGWTVAGTGLVVGAAMFRRPRQQAVSSEVTGQDTGTTSRSADRWTRLAGDCCVGLMAGMALAVAVRMTGQLVAHWAYVTFAQLAGVTAGIAAGIWLRRGNASSTRDALPLTELLVISFSLSALVVLFPELTTAALQISADVSGTFSILLLRGGLLIASLSPFGAVIGLRLAGASARVGDAASGRSLRTVSIAALAFAATRAVDLPVPAGMTLAVTAAAAALGVGWLRIPSATHHRRRLVLATALLAPLVAACFWTSRFNSSRSARILFSTNALLAYRDDTPVDQLPLIDDGRLVDEFRRDGATWTTWLYAGEQLVVRENGLPRGATSLDPRKFPEVPAEMLPAVLPLIIHPAPRQVTLVGVGGTTTLSACLAFPVVDVTCVEPHRGLLQAARQCGADAATPDPFQDSRLRVICAEPALAAAARQPLQDIIILNCGQASLWDASAEFTTDWYRRLAGRLAPGGLLCQRLYYGDFGAQPVRDLASTLQAVFPQVMLIETGPGEIVFIATRNEEPILSPDLLERAARPQVRTLLSRLGWDWSVLLTMASLDAGAVQELADSEPARANRVAGGRFAFQLPVEVARWGPKQEEINDLLGTHSKRLFNLIDDEAGVQDLALRLADVREWQRIIEKHPDVFWAYRSSLRARLQERPRMTIQQVAHEGLSRALHPEDQRRKAFLLALSEAATQSAPDIESLRRLEQFVEPYDPLVTFFAHHELANLYARAEPPDPAAELAHRLHTVNFGGGSDLSVRNVTAAIDLIIEQPHVLPDPQRRWDTLNALLEVLMRRWQMRAGAGGASKYEAADVNNSFNAAEAALDAMDELAPEVAVTPGDWKIRRSLLEQRLIRPLRNHRSEQRT